MTTDQNFCAWPDRKFLWLVRPRQNSSRTAVFCNWGDRSTSDRRPKRFLRLARQKVFQLAWPKHNFTPREVYLQLARPYYKCQPTSIFLQLRWLQRKWTPTEVFLRLERSNVFASGANDAKMDADRSVSAPSATEYFFDWHGRSTTVHQPQLSCNWGDRSTNGCRQQFSCNWRGRSTSFADRFFLHLAQLNVLTTGANNVKWTPTEVFLPLTRSNVFASGANDAKMDADRTVFAPSATQCFFDWRERCKNEGRSKFFFVPGATERFCVWR